MIYGYARVSTKEQNLDRQLEELKKYEMFTKTMQIFFRRYKNAIR